METTLMILQKIIHVKDTLLNDTILVKVLNTVSTLDASKGNDIDYLKWIPIIISIIIVSYTLWDRLKWSVISGKIISYAYSTNSSFVSTDKFGKDFTLKGIRFFMKVSINVLRKNVYYKNLNVYVKFPNDNKLYKGKFYSGRDNWPTLTKSERFLKIPSDKLLLYNNVLEKEKVLFYYVRFFIDKAEYELFEEIIIEFIDSKGRKRKMEKIYSKDMNAEESLYEEELWVDKQENPV